jgi:hypothetical protein
LNFGSPCAALFITILHPAFDSYAFDIQRVIKEQAVPGGPEAELMPIS